MPGVLPKDWNREKLSSLKWIQLASAGFEAGIRSSLYNPEDENPVIITSSSGIHVVQIPEQVFGYIIAINRKFQEYIVAAKTDKKWVKADFASHRELRGSTIGVLGYGSIGREIGRLGKAFGCEILACTSSGKKSPQEGFIVPGTGDADGSIPTSWFSTKDKDSFHSFLSRSQILVICLPATPQTKHMINSHTLSLLPPSSILVNIGRGSLINTDDLLAHLDAPDSKLLGVGLDVTEPEPLPDNHPLFNHPRVFLTPHTAGGSTKYATRNFDLFEKQVERAKRGEPVWNAYDPKKGY
ncbi:hypothetical protein BT69DRAFT_1246363 [Atractiella rhizophila]|nr:hypothetical protein BT69DRAFT_1246363 [Atractiella rhizophila]